MTDIVSGKRRSEIMSHIQAKGMKPELAVRKLVHRLGYRFRLHVSELPGKPDLVFASRRKVIFVHGCFWHRHKNKICRIQRLPVSRREYWLPKLAGNRRRDAKHQARLRGLGWAVLVIWECETRDEEVMARRVRRFLGVRKPGLPGWTSSARYS